MCNVFCKEFKGWCKSFTRTEALLSILEACLLIFCIVLLVFVILHFLACTSDMTPDAIYNEDTTTKPIIAHKPNVDIEATIQPGVPTKTPFSLESMSECTWKPSEKTTAGVKYYEYNTTANMNADIQSTSDTNDFLESDKQITDLDNIMNKNATVELDNTTEETKKITPYFEYDATEFLPDESDGEEAEDFYQQYVLALVKMNPPKDITFGCILTIVTEYWTITAASCIEAIEEVDSLDSFVMMEDYGQVRKGRSHVISDVQIHPMYEGVNKSYDLVALKSEDSLMIGSGYTVDLPDLIDYLMITIAERFVLLGYGPYRTIDNGPHGKRLHKVNVYSLPSGQCPRAGAWALRHLWGGEAAGARGCGAGALCAGALAARGAPCNYCAGAPLLRGTRLLGLMSDNQQCGVACEPQYYVNIAAVRDWLDFTTGTK